MDWKVTVLRLVLAVLCGGLIGLERERKKRPAGFRTYILVCVGSALVIMTNEFIVKEMGGGDYTRMGAQVISGIGFLGAGTIIVTSRNHVRGLTTAAGLWASACMGLAIGAGFYVGAIVSCLIIFISMSALHDFDERVMSKSRVINLYIEFETPSGLSAFITELKKRCIRVTDMEISKSGSINNSNMGVILNLKLDRNRNHTEMIHELGSIAGVCYIEEV